MKEKTALKIDVVNRIVTEVKIKHYTEIYALIGNGCELFECPVNFDNSDTLYVDEEGLLNSEPNGCFMLKIGNYPLFLGNAVILGTDEEGDSISCKSKVKDITNMIVWGSDVDAIRFKKERL